MRLVDVCIPKFDDDDDQAVPKKTVSAPFHLPPAFFRQGDGEYNIEDDHVEEEGEYSGDASSSREEQFFEADDGSVNVRLPYHCHPVRIKRPPATRSASTFY
jgi:hypothetical protein